MASKITMQPNGLYAGYDDKKHKFTFKNKTRNEAIEEFLREPTYQDKEDLRRELEKEFDRDEVEFLGLNYEWCVIDEKKNKKIK